MLEFLIAMENETGEMCFYYLFNLWDIYMQKQHLVVKIDICIHACIMCGQYRTVYDLFIYCFSAKMEKKEKNQPGPSAPSRCVELVFCSAFFQFLRMMDFNCELIFFSFLFFCSKYNLIMVSNASPSEKKTVVAHL